MADPTPLKQSTFKRNGHINYFLRCLRALPTAAQGSDSNRITAAFFCISALDLLGALYEKTSEEQRKGWIEWVWSLQAPTGGFRGSTFMTTLNDKTSPAHIPSTYTALMTLAILRAPLDLLDIPGLTRFLRSCQAKDGSFSPVPGDEVYPNEGFQSDVRISYCTSVISDIIGDFSGMDVDKSTEFIERCKTWEGAYASRPGVIEAQGGTTYCSLAALSILHKHAQAPSPESQDTLRWLISRQIGGFQGRPGKLEDVCYSFWCGGAMSILGHSTLINREADRSFLLSAQFPLGGFGKEPEDYPDPFHSYLALAALSLTHSGTEDGDNAGLGLKELDVIWNVSRETADWLRGEIGRVNGKSRS
ncbi:hypothetical protein I302_103636 [Kwoniella bestiolae CBS 10118]|uniref:Geranylgeranyl transferase type-1 subunit beta n=1 Tax=Kwoniella bestiolae CBS 10118 TaxID=1296100 RepID=A0A1B9G8Y2_9TREE|nr:geranylgeranyl transferase type-1 subunit beta [Kwoniella bestiolae CBS 10118]OCF27498.1 geranylgeranyl transferase type-1 subunit beta [Kwoniella bestiolae CBS 10118]